MRKGRSEREKEKEWRDEEGSGGREWGREESIIIKA